jgi:beta-lactam-binding protein with PASTA domain
VLGDSIRRRRGPAARPGRQPVGPDAPEGPEDRPGPEPRTLPPWLVWIGLAVGVTGGSFLIGYLLASQFLFPRPETAGVGVPVPSLYGLEQEVAREALEQAGLRLGPVTEVASLRVRPGRVVAQAPIPEQQLRPGGEVALAVSAGPPEVRVPPVTGLGEAAAQALLEAAGFEVDVRQVRSPAVPPGRAVRTDPEAGTVLPLPASLDLLVNVGPPEIEPADAAALDPTAPDTAEGGA